MFATYAESSSLFIGAMDSTKGFLLENFFLFFSWKNIFENNFVIFMLSIKTVLSLSWLAQFLTAILIGWPNSSYWAWLAEVGGWERRTPLGPAGTESPALH